MGRPGTGGSGGGSFGGHSSGRTSGGHRVGGSGGGRPGTSGNSYRSSYSGMGSYRHYGPMFIRGGGYAGGPILPLLICLFILIVTVSSNMGNAPKSTRNRERLDNPVAYTNQCVVDEIGWIENPARLSKELQGFYKETGVQPYIVLHAYDSTLKTDAEKQEYAKQYYEEHIKNEGTFLYMYFGEPNDTEVGYMAYVNGKAVSSVMDAEAVDIFWTYIDRYWTDEGLTMTDVFIKTFDKTAATIMTKSTTTKDIVKYAIVGIVIVSAGVIVVILVKQKHKREKERAEETERILNTPLDEDTPMDDLKDKYL